MERTDGPSLDAHRSVGELQATAKRTARRRTGESAGASGRDPPRIRDPISPRYQKEGEAKGLGDRATFIWQTVVAGQRANPVWREWLAGATEQPAAAAEQTEAAFRRRLRGRRLHRFSYSMTDHLRILAVDWSSAPPASLGGKSGSPEPTAVASNESRGAATASKSPKT